ncbi:hypothetical protein EQG41_01505 [Billgrantia azerbaijanica]|nr:hypothetical protein EQG41_01505 [Halomonas azerbaijanica]
MIHTPPGDRRQCRSLTLRNGLRVLLLADPDADQAGAAMSVAAGSSQEPPELPGLAHLLEHMLFLGTEKYPAADDFPSYVQGHGGRYNATTESDQTRYFFEVPPAHLAGALDRFAQFFIAPCLDAAAVAREREVIDAEYRARLADDEQCILGVIKQVLDPGHPASRFFAGNRESLDATPEALRRALVAFHARYYAAANLQLVVVGTPPLARLEQVVEAAFAAIPERPRPAPAAWPALLPADELPRWLALRPNRPCHELRLCFPVPALQPEDYQQPWDYLGELLTFRGAGGLQGQLRDRGWLTAIDTGILLETRPQALFQIRLSLTPEGMRHGGAVAAAVFAGLRRIATDGIAAWRHRERQALAAQRFRLAAATSTVDQVKTLAYQLHRYPMTEALRGPYRLDAFRPEVIRRCLAHLTPDNLLALAIDPATQGEHTSPHFPTPYRRVAPPPLDDVADDAALDVALPPPNPFITEAPTAATAHDAPAPRPLRDAGACRLWYQPLAGFPAGRMQLCLNLVSAHATSARDTQVLTALLVAWLEEALAAELQQARTAGLEVTLERHHQGIALQARGAPEALERLLPRLMQCLAHEPIRPLRVTQARQALQERWERQRHDYAFRRLLQLPAVRLGHGFSEAEGLAELASLDAERLSAFRHALLGGVALDGLLAGDLAPSQAERLAALLEAQLAPGGEGAPVARCVPGGVPLQTGKSYHYRLDTPHADSAVALYLPASDDSPSLEVCYRLLAALLHDAFYQRLRVEEQLGYVVLARYLPVHESPGLILLVQSPSQSVAELQRRIGRFLTAPDAPPLACDAARFAHYRDGLLQALTQQQRQPDQRVAQSWAALNRGDTAVERPRQLAQALADLTLEELQRFYQRQLLPSPWMWLHT